MKKNWALEYTCKICETDTDWLICNMCLSNRQNDVNAKLNFIPDTSDDTLISKYGIGNKWINLFLSLDFLENTEENWYFLEEINKFLYTWTTEHANWFYF